MKRGTTHIEKWLGTALPLVLFAGLLGFGATMGGRDARAGQGEVIEAGLSVSKRGFGNRSRYLDRRSRGASRVVTASAAADSGRRPLFSRAASRPTRPAGEKELTVSKGSVAYTRVKLGQQLPRWKYLTPGLRRQIDAAGARHGRWRHIVIHNSATTRGNAKAFDRYHRNVKKMRNGLAYHFVIGNGSYSGDGEIEIGHRWARQLAGGHMKSSAQNEVAIGVCLVGNFDSDKVRDAQLEALNELVTYLQAKCGKVEVTTHRQMNVVPTSCPGRYFPDRQVMAAYNR